MKVHVHATIEEDLAKWMDDKVREKKYYNRTHVLEAALMELKKKETVKL
jgi:Arc/MetJ-type ribon-helix-helix transcriptional regulator